MRLTGREAVYPKSHLSLYNEARESYLCPLRNAIFVHSDQVWCSNIIHIGLLHGFVYLMVLVEWYSRYILLWGLSTILDTAFLSLSLAKGLGGMSTRDLQE